MSPVADAAAIDAFLEVFEAAWAFPRSDEWRSRIAVDLSREQAVAAHLDDRMVGTSMSFSMELTLPGAVPAPMAGVSYVAVHPLFRRRGVLRALMRHQLDGLISEGVALAGLGASEAEIYGRFGYGPATREIRWRCARGARLRAGEPDPGSLALVGDEEARRILPAVHDAARRRQVGEVRTYPGRWHDLISADRCFLVHSDGHGGRDGYAIYRLERPEQFSAHGTLIVEHLVSASDAAYRSMWAFLLDLDLTGQVEAGGRPESEPLQWMLRDPRRLVVTDVRDHLWLRLVDLPAALAARRYGAEGSLVLEVADDFCPWNEGRWHLEAGPDGATCRPAARSRGTDLRLTASVLASLYLGTAPLAGLATAGRLRGDAPALERAAAMFGTLGTPWCSLGF